jgi:hypothetical protein
MKASFAAAARAFRPLAGSTSRTEPQMRTLAAASATPVINAG